MTARGETSDDDPGDLAPDLLAQLQELLLDAAPPLASVTEWDDTLAHVLGAEAPLEATDWVPDQTTWTEHPADAPVWDDAGPLGGAWESDHGWRPPEDADWPGPGTDGDDDLDGPDGPDGPDGGDDL